MVIILLYAIRVSFRTTAEVFDYGNATIFFITINPKDQIHNYRNYFHKKTNAT